MRAFVAVADAGSFTLASRRLERSRAMVSKLVMDLEEHLGLRLLSRTTRRVALTEAGAAYFERCRDVLGALEEAEREVMSQAAEPVGRLRISAPVSFGSRLLAPRLSDYARRFSRVSIDLVLNDRFVDLVEEGYDLAIRIGRLAESSLIARRIASTPIVICGSPAYLALRGTPVKLQDLVKHDCIQYAYASGGATWRLAGADGQVQAVRTGGHISCNNGDAIGRMAAAGLGLSLQPEFIVARELRSGELVAVLEDYTREELGIYAVYPSHRHVPLKLRTFIDFLAEAFGGDGAR
ncbi:MAG: LysR family transcriptional regulator [Hyphomicrobium sp.]|jgi:DNA-binding transcriptional LysR family regulator